MCRGLHMLREVSKDKSSIKTPRGQPKAGIWNRFLYLATCNGPANPLRQKESSDRLHTAAVTATDLIPLQLSFSDFPSF
ncbi:hypothetical protein BHE74_00058920 [Ensete ventricosum]|nr:hypothetical protein BHE74_00058920 [Ensete ventricosum]